MEDFKKGIFRIWRLSSKIDNLMSDVYGSIEGSDSMEWDGLMTPIYQIQNVGNGQITGIFSSFQWNIWKKLYLTSSLTYTQGIVEFFQ